MKTLYGGIEAGGTKFVCVVAGEPANGKPAEIYAEVRFPTTTPDETIGRAVQFFQEQAQQARIPAIGVGAFGPVDLDPNSPAYGSVTTTPKPGWAHTPLAERLQSALQIPVAFDTDVNVAAIGEHRWGAGKGQDPFIYITIGTGVGGGGILNGAPLHGLVHPEMGHARLPHDWQADPFAGACPFHGDCFEGLASGPALLRRWGQPAETLPPDHPAWVLEARYIALALNNLIVTLSPRRIVLGGGVMQQHFLFPMLRRQVQELLNGYVQAGEILEDMDHYIVPPGLGAHAGVLGCVAMALDLAEKI